MRESAAGSAAASRIGSTKRFMGPHIHNVAIAAILSRTHLPLQLKLPQAFPAVIPALYGTGDGSVEYSAIEIAHGRDRVVPDSDLEADERVSLQTGLRRSHGSPPEEVRRSKENRPCNPATVPFGLHPARISVMPVWKQAAGNGSPKRTVLVLARRPR